MIHLNDLTEKDVGRGVFYTDGSGKEEFGVIKSWNYDWIFVVYHCADNWSDFRNYTAAATNPEDLDFASSREWNSDITRFDLIDID